MTEVGGLAAVLQSYGPWAMVAVLIVALVGTAKAYVDIRDRYLVSDAERSKAELALVEEMVKATVEQKAALEKLVEALRALERRVENVEKT